MMDCSLCPINEQRKPSFEKYVKQHSDTLRAKDIEPILFMSWPYKNTPKMQVALEKAFFDAATTNRIRLIPAGPAFFYVNQNLLMFFYTPSLLKKYLNLCCFYNHFQHIFLLLH